MKPDPRALPVVVGLAVGEGTGPELAGVFEETLTSWAAARGRSVRLERSPILYRTFGGVVAAGLSAAEVERSALDDARAYEAFLRELHARGGRVVFRTAFNAQPLYTVRERLEAVKIEPLPVDGGEGGEMLLVRDQVQGFYGGENDPVAGDGAEIRRTCVFSREKTFRLLDFALAEAVRRWGGADRIDQFVMAYKFHLLDGRFAAWVADYGRERGVNVRVYQPDTMNRNLLRGRLRGHVVLVAGNEWGDIMHADLLARAGLGAQEERATQNVYLAPSVAGMVEYQTVHGSADDIAGQGIVNPAATLRATAAILERHAGCEGMIAEVDGALAAAGRILATPDAGGQATTRAMVDEVNRQLRAPAARRRPTGTALVIVDMQRDFCAPGGRFDALGLIDPEATQALVEPIDALLDAARARGVDVVFVRSHGNETRLPLNVAERNRKLGRAGWLTSGGDDFFGVSPLPSEKVVTKDVYDAFLGTDLEAHLRAAGVRELVACGVFSDLCVDALARTAYQKGFRVRLAVDATLPLERDARQTAAFMARYYDAALETVNEVVASWSVRPLAAAGGTR